MNIIEKFKTEILDKFVDGFTTLLPKLILAVVILVLSLWLINIICNSMKKMLAKSKIEKTLHSFTISSLRVMLRIVAIIVVADILGLPMGTFIAALGAAGVAVALAIKDNLSDFASGILLIITKPFKVGDIIEAEGSIGTVSEIQLTYSILKTPDNKKVIIPNSKLASSKVVNLSSEELRRVDISFYVGISTDIDMLKEILFEIISKNEMAYKEKTPVIGISGQTVNTLTIDVLVWCYNKNYWDLYYELNESFKKELYKQGIIGTNA